MSEYAFKMYDYYKKNIREQDIVLTIYQIRKNIKRKDFYLMK